MLKVPCKLLAQGLTSLVTLMSVRMCYIQLPVTLQDVKLFAHLGTILTIADVVFSVKTIGGHPSYGAVEVMLDHFWHFSVPIRKKVIDNLSLKVINAKP